ncbi:Nuclear actin-protein involved in chromatin remodeling [Rhizophlyctis rosea]|uniref:Nuclear actin-protein involved in chromatin remodeling n=1 Tax=Rhizophlyctis rosea TaxID=64517 RepID=A0AAD5SHK3_9FUNG|nr:Nuclear actin-protein involved in chromatin remodeling [Rhizophlyctis rosea]
MEGIEDVEEKEIPTFPLVNIPDEELDDEGKKEKRRQRLMKAGYDARERMKREKEEEKAREAEKAREEEERRLQDPEKWLEGVRERRQALVDRIRARQRKKAQLSDRRSQASQSRMKSIAALAADEAPTKRRRRGQDDDNFGANDDDWGVYRDIRRGEDDDDSDEEDDSIDLAKLDDLLIAHDPSFVPEDVFDETKSFRNTILHRLAWGTGAWDPSDPATMSQVHLNVERCRVPEVIFQPSIIGLDQAGLVECVTEILKRFDEEQRQGMVKNILVTGGNSLYTNLTQRIENEIRAIQPFGSTIKCVQLNKPPTTSFLKEYVISVGGWFDEPSEFILRDAVTNEKLFTPAAVKGSRKLRAEKLPTEVDGNKTETQPYPRRPIKIQTGVQHVAFVDTNILVYYGHQYQNPYPAMCEKTYAVFYTSTAQREAALLRLSMVFAELYKGAMEGHPRKASDFKFPAFDYFWANFRREFDSDQMDLFVYLEALVAAKYIAQDNPDQELTFQFITADTGLREIIRRVTESEDGRATLRMLVSDADIARVNVKDV